MVQKRKQPDDLFNNSESGFSLIEVLVTLAILSVSSALIFQSLWSQMALVERVETATAAAVQDRITRSGFGQVIGGLTPAWPEEEQSNVFVGDGSSMSGLTATPLTADELDLPQFEMSIDPQTQALEYRSGDITIQLVQFNGPAQFHYLGQDDFWVNEWPLDDIPDPGPFDDSADYVMPPLPKAVRIQVDDQLTLDWIAFVDWQSSYIVRRQDLDLGE